MNLSSRSALLLCIVWAFGPSSPAFAHDCASDLSPQRITIRPVESHDVDRLVEISQMSEVADMAGTIDPFLSRAMYEADADQDARQAHWRKCFVIEQDGKLVGVLGFWFSAPPELGRNEGAKLWLSNNWVQLGRSIDPAFWGTGIGTEAARLAAQHAFDVLGFDGVMTCSLKANVRARRSIEKAGFTQYSERGRYVFYLRRK